MLYCQVLYVTIKAFLQDAIRTDIALIAEVTVHKSVKTITVTRIMDYAYMVVLIINMSHQAAQVKHKLCWLRILMQLNMFKNLCDRTAFCKM